MKTWKILQGQELNCSMTPLTFLQTLTSWPSHRGGGLSQPGFSPTPLQSISLISWSAWWAPWLIILHYRKVLSRTWLFIMEAHSHLRMLRGF